MNCTLFANSKADMVLDEVVGTTQHFNKIQKKKR